MRVMGLDASLKTVGIAVVEYKHKKMNLVHYEYYKPDKNVSEFERLQQSRDYILKVAKDFKCKKFAIEEYIKFMAGGSGAKTILPLAVFNRTIGLGIFEKYGAPTMLNVNTVRAVLKRNIGLTDRIKKEEIPDAVRQLGIKFTDYTEIKKNGNIKVLEETYDVADAIAVAMTYIFNELS